MIHKTMIASAKAVDEAEGIVEAFTNTMGVIDADGDIVEPTAFDSSIAGNLPIPVLSGHDQAALVGKVIFAQPRHIEGDEYRLFTRMQFNMETEAGRDAFSNVAGDYVREWSIGFNIPQESDVEQEGSDVSTVVRRIGNLDWVEVSSVIRGSSPATSTVAAKSSPVTDAEKAAIPSHLTAWVEEAWDGQLMRGRIKGGAATLRAAHAWVDPDGDPELKSSYKYLHHHIGRNGRGGAANVRAITTALANLNARRTSIPENDRRGVYNHLARHLREAGRKPSELRSAEPPDHSKPYPNFHACRIREPDEFDRFRTADETIDDKPVVVLYGREIDTEDWDIASYHLPVDEWTEDEARAFCEEHDGIKFEPATGEDDDEAGDDDAPADDDATDEAASGTAPEVALDTAERTLRLQRIKLALHGIHNQNKEF
jgi:HK97 family phage prohead protease